MPIHQWFTARLLGCCVAFGRLGMGGFGAEGWLDADSSSECRMGCARLESHIGSSRIHLRQLVF